MALAALMVCGITTAAPALGARVSGLFSPFPVAASMLAASTHRAEGAAAAQELLRALGAGLVSLAAFFVTAGMLLGRANIASVFGAATAATFASHAGVWWHERRRRVTGGRLTERGRPPRECIE
ncbi:MAG TPA: hypothetical protein VF041_19320 [Gemmatimonadaceae bacterium]